MRHAILFIKLKNNRVKCTACSWYCRIAPGQVGICATRLNKNGRLYSLVYGKPIGLHLDPVEKKPLYHFLPGSNILSFGTAGCNFGCLFCQNAHMSQLNKLYLQNNLANIETTLTKVIDQLSDTATPKQIVSAALHHQAAGIAYTYNEPTIFAEFAHDTMVLAHKKGLKNIYVSNGFESIETFNYLKPHLDAINIDLKSIHNRFYQQLCLAKIDPVLANIKRFFQANIHLEVTTLIIPGHNDSTKELSSIARFIAKISSDIPWHISAFHPAYQMADTPPTPHSTLLRAYQLGKKAGLNYIYTGNVPDPTHSATHCPHCHQTLISRSGYRINIENLELNQGTCQKCGHQIYGLWS